jgi:uncharacterized protein VirK/YbjX
VDDYNQIIFIENRADDESFSARHALATREDVIHCYRTLLEREPENEEIVLSHLSNKPTLWELLTTFIQSHEFRYIQNNPLYDNKLRDYLAKCFTYKIRHACFCYNCAFLCETLSDAAFESLRHGDVTLLFERRALENIYAVTVQVGRECPNEGEITLHFRANGVRLFVVSFTIIPGYAVGLNNKSVILISRMQGQKGRFSEIRQSTRELKQVSPQAILFSVIKGIARAIGVETIAGTCARNSIWCNDDQSDLVVQSYDQFYESIGASGPFNGFYLSSVKSPGTPRPLLVKPGHRLRTKIKRRLKEEISEAACLAWRRLGDQNIPVREPPKDAAVWLATKGGMHPFSSALSRFFLPVRTMLSKVRRVRKD